jgi:putative ABC transport system permease protein
MGNLLRDLRYGVRTLSRSPGFAVVAILSLALGIGANTAIFELLDSVRMRSLPVPDAERLVEVRLSSTDKLRGGMDSWDANFSHPLWEALRDHMPSAMSGVVAWYADDFNIAPPGSIRHVYGLWVSGDFFTVLGVRPTMGRVFAAGDDQRGCGLPGAVVSDAFWRRELGGDRGAIGRTITVDGHPVPVVGVTPVSFTGVEVGAPFDIALPLCSQPLLGTRASLLDDGTSWWLTVVARLKPGSTIAQASAELATISPRIFASTVPKNYPRESIPDYLGLTFVAQPASNGVSSLREQYDDPLWLMLATAGLVLLIACTNLANLILARATARERELAVRLAIGASRSRLIQQLSAESVLLAVAGGALGLWIAGELSRVLVSLLSTQGNDVFLDLRADWRVLLFTSGVSALTCLAFGLAPAWRASSVSPSATLSAGGRSVTDWKGIAVRRGLVGVQVALALVLLYGGVLFSRTLYNLVTVDPGFRAEGVLVAGIDLTDVPIPVGQALANKQELLDRIRAIPGVEAAADVRYLPMGGSGVSNVFWPEGSEKGKGFNVGVDGVSGEYFQTLAIPLVAGRDFDRRDTPGSAPVAIVNRAFVRQLGSANPLGVRLRREATPSDTEKGFEIVGVVGDTRYRDLHKGNVPIVYLATSQDAVGLLATADVRFTNKYVQVVVRSTTPIAATASAIRDVVHGMTPIATTEFDEYPTVIRASLLRERLVATLSGFFGILAALLATIGLYGVMSYQVSRRTNEIGIRMTLGADPREIVRMVLREAGRVFGAGVAVGVVISLIGATAVRAMVYGVRPFDLLTLVTAVGLLGIAGLAASYLPARRAARLDPAVALKEG